MEIPTLYSHLGLLVADFSTFISLVASNENRLVLTDGDRVYILRAEEI